MVDGIQIRNYDILAFSWAFSSKFRAETKLVAIDCTEIVT